MKVSESLHFSKAELKCSHCSECEMESDLMEMLEGLRKKIRKPIHLNSAYRCDAHNLAVGGVRGSAHTQGRAVDIRISGEDAYVMIDFAFDLGFTGIGIKRHGKYPGRYIHLDIQGGDMRPRAWSYP